MVFSVKEIVRSFPEEDFQVYFEKKTYWFSVMKMPASLLDDNVVVFP